MDFKRKLITPAELELFRALLPDISDELILQTIGCKLDVPEKLEPKNEATDRVLPRNDNEQEMFIVDTEKSPLANMTIALLVGGPASFDIEAITHNTNYFMLIRCRELDSGKTSGYHVFAGSNKLSDQPYQTVKKISVNAAFNLLAPFQKDPAMLKLANTALESYNQMNRTEKLFKMQALPLSEKVRATVERIEELFKIQGKNDVQVETRFKVPVKMKEPRSSADLQFETIFCPGQVILAKESNSGRWVATEYYGHSDGRFHVTNGIKVRAIAIFDKAMLGKKEIPKGFRYWQLCGACLTAWRQA